MREGNPAIASYEIPGIWNSCYDDSWDGLISPESFAHP